MAKKTIIGKFLKLVGAGTDGKGAPLPKTRKERTGTPTPFQSKWMTTEELIEVPNNDDRNEIASLRESNWRAQLSGNGFAGINPESKWSQRLGD